MSILGTSALSVSLMNGNVVAELKVLNRVSGQETKTEKVAKVGHKEENRVYIRKATEEANLLPHVEEKLGKSLLFMSTMIYNGVMPAPSCEACICNVFLTRLTSFAVTEISHGTVRSKTHKAERTDSLGNGHPEPLNGLVNTVARFEVSRYNKGQPLCDRVCMEYVDNNSYEVKSCPESQYNMWDCCFTQLFSYGKLPYDYDDQRATEKEHFSCFV